MTEDGRTDAEMCADRALAEAVAQWQLGRHATAAALFRATARYVDRIGEDRTTGEVVFLPSPARTAGLGLVQEGARW